MWRHQLLLLLLLLLVVVVVVVAVEVLSSSAIYNGISVELSSLTPINCRNHILYVNKYGLEVYMHINKT